MQEQNKQQQQSSTENKGILQNLKEGLESATESVLKTGENLLHKGEQMLDSIGIHLHPQKQEDKKEESSTNLPPAESKSEKKNFDQKSEKLPKQQEQQEEESSLGGHPAGHSRAFKQTFTPHARERKHEIHDLQFKKNEGEVTKLEYNTDNVKLGQPEYVAHDRITQQFGGEQYKGSAEFKGVGDFKATEHVDKSKELHSEGLTRKDQFQASYGGASNIDNIESAVEELKKL